MKTSIVLALALFAGALPAAAQMPFPLWRNVGGTNYNLQPLYGWRSDMVVKAATRQPTDELEKARPYPDWLGANYREHFTVKEVRKPDLLLVERQSRRSPTRSGELVLQHYPQAASLTEGQHLEFFACPLGQCTWTNQAGAVTTLPLFDYGTPCPPPQRVAERLNKRGGA